MSRISQILVAVLTVCNAFQSSVNRASLMTKSMSMALNGNENNVPKSMRDDLVQPMNRGKILFRMRNVLPVLQSLS
jgi:hypothetical protein